MRTVFKSLVLFIFFTFITACVRTRIIRYETSPRPSKPASFPMEIYDSSDISRPFKVIGIVTANAGKLHSTQDTINKMKAKAKEMGGDALMDLGFGTSDGRLTQKIKSGYISNSPRENWVAKVVVWLDK